MRTLALGGALVVAIAAIGIYKSTAAPGPAVTVAPGEDPPDPLGDKRWSAREQHDATLAKCGKQLPIPYACLAARGRVIADIVEELEDLETGEGNDEALLALDISDPMVERAALRHLANQGLASETKVRARFVKLLAESPYVAVGELAARAIDNQGGAYAAYAKRWRENHRAFSLDDYTQEYWSHRPAFDLGKAGFPSYPGATPNAAGDTDRSLGFATTDSVDKVVAFFSKQPGAKLVDSYEPWMRDRMMRDNSSGAGVTTGDVQEMQRLMAEFRKTHDQKLLEQIKVISDKLKAPVKPGVAMSPAATEPYAYHLTGDARAIVLEDKGHVTRMVFVYAEPALGGTAFEVAWSLVEQPALAAATRTQVNKP